MLPCALWKCEQNKFLVDPVDTQLKAFQQKDHFSRVPSCGLGMMLTHKSAGLLQGGRKGAARGAYEPSPGPGSVQAGERWTLRYSTENRRSSAKGLGDGSQSSARSQSAPIYILGSLTCPYLFLS